ncbi:methyl-accepting chemotaxis protein [Rossellomorea vietnamensis]|uniref:Methyl-accepting chemotaxis protein n=1 Tax=Rossellomorea vietnamensis TaxID=218284 RepID=A0A5D4NJJ0_9BACI|nr:HAMP domain-containing methyl-accepting chemotaxis protein [Rossellomorea vietnamensis]TYS13112.1 methyl-accepting chemotaxis protein [Rossellomorea vietnamensis]
MKKLGSKFKRMPKNEGEKPKKAKKEKGQRAGLSLWKNMKIGQKYIIALNVTIVLFLISSVIIFMQFNKIQDNIEKVDVSNVRSVQLTEMGSIFRDKALLLQRYANEKSPQIVEDFNSQAEKFNTLEEDLSSQMKTKQEQQLFSFISESDKELNTLFRDEVVPSVDMNSTVLLDTTLKKAGIIAPNIVSKLNELRTIVMDNKDAALEEAYEGIGGSKIIMIAAVIISAVLGIAILVIINRMISSSLNRVVKTANLISEGKLNADELTYLGKDEVGQLSLAINNMKNNLASMVRDMRKVSETVTEQSATLSQSSLEVREGSSQIAVTMQDLSAGSDQQANSASELNEMMMSFTKAVEESNRFGQEVSESSKVVLSKAEEGSLLMSQSVEQMKKIYTVVETSVEKVETLKTRSNEISSLVNVIQGIADQTNLLALNAAIEAARAGESGKGFAVVAEEVRKLAVQVSQSLEGISKVVHGIQNESNTIAASLNDGYTEVRSGTESIERTKDSLTGLGDQISSMVHNIDRISHNLVEINSKGSEMNESIENIASISEESAAGVEETSATVQQSTSVMEEVARNAESLNDLADKLDVLIRKFEV